MGINSTLIKTILKNQADENNANVLHKVEEEKK